MAFGFVCNLCGSSSISVQQIISSGKSVRFWVVVFGFSVLFFASFFSSSSLLLGNYLVYGATGGFVCRC